MATKYKVSQCGKVFGNFHANDAQSAVDKAIDKWSGFCNVDLGKAFNVVHGLRTYVVKRG